MPEYLGTRIIASNEPTSTRNYFLAHCCTLWRMGMRQWVLESLAHAHAPVGVYAPVCVCTGAWACTKEGLHSLAHAHAPVSFKFMCRSFKFMCQKFIIFI